ncbi:EAL domain-containing protein [Sideroxydans sp. CL21]|uniref:putative bifunctional diguanylate cyclase/phosphodiesterase n=1 Tax=Sideroxydans sp. CL21 TaxID=2600596 RepID=UPI0024BD398F|nr:EAL domain-containing protein [Sideroxydans sp. CL21]
MKFKRLKDKLLLSAVAVSVAVALVTLLTVSLVVRQQNMDQSYAHLRKASSVIEEELANRKENLLTASRQLANQKNLGSTIWYLAQYAQLGIDRETLFSTYQQLVKDTYKIGRVAQLSRIAIYDSSGRLISFALFDRNSKQVGFVEHSRATVIQAATLRDGEELSRQNLRATTSTPKIGLQFEGPLPRQESMHYAVKNGMLVIESYVPVMGEAFDASSGKQRLKQLGLVVMEHPFDQSFVDQLSRLTDTRINVFIPQGFSVGSLPVYRNPDWSNAKQGSAAPGKLLNEITVDGEGYYQSLMSLYEDDKIVGSIAALYSKSIVEKNTWEMVKTLGLIAAISLLFIFAVAWYFATSISKPLTTLSRIFRSVAGDASGNLSNELGQLEKEKARGDELGDLTQSFIAMNDAINQKIQQINEINASLERTVEERTAALASSEQDLRSMIENSPDTIARYNRDCRRVYVNPAFGRITEGGAASLLNKRPSEVPGGENFEIYEARIREVFSTGNNAQFELKWPRKDGKVIYSHIRLTAERDISGNVTSVLGVGRDITELNNSRAELKHANDQLEELNQQLQSLATNDPLTQLPNRRLLMDRLKHALAASARNSKAGALLFIDLDNFKAINDTLGHDSGDLLLQQVARRLEGCVRNGDTVARIGGDEFVVMLEDLSMDAMEAAAHAETVGNKILAALNVPYDASLRGSSCTPSIGITLFDDRPQSIDELLRQADIAMYESKKFGRNTLHFFDPQMQRTIDARAAIESQLRLALKNGQFRLYYQIQVDSLHRTLGAEALIRWAHPERGLVAPAEFIPLAEEIGLILPIGQWVLDTACIQLKAWEGDALTRSLILAVNVSAKQFRQPDFVAQIRSLVQRHAVDPRLLKLELTESLLLENIEDTIVTMSEIKKIGVRLSLDDFGTGYSSLQYLKRLPLDQLKIDRSFVRDITVDSNDKIIVSTIIAMAQNLNLNVIAEGVETEEQRQLLMKIGCSNFQGCLFGKAEPVDQFEVLLKQIAVPEVGV